MHNLNRGDLVRYIPSHANHNPFHSDCEDGVVVKVDQQNAWVKYNYGPDDEVIVEDPSHDITAQRTNKRDLIKRPFSAKDIMERWLDWHNARLLTECTHERFTMRLVAVQGEPIVIQEWKGGKGFQVYLPAANNMVATLDQLEELIAGEG